MSARQAVRWASYPGFVQAVPVGGPDTVKGYWLPVSYEYDSAIDRTRVGFVPLLPSDLESNFSEGKLEEK